MTDNEIIEALECCKTTLSEIGACKECPLYQGEGHTCITTLSKNALDLINRQRGELRKKQVKIHKLLKELNQVQDYYEIQNAEIGNLRNYIHDRNLAWDLLSYSKRNGR